jgi:hypothetical protein
MNDHFGRLNVYLGVKYKRKNKANKQKTNSVASSRQENYADRDRCLRRS